MTLPTGTVTFLFTDIEGSTKLARRNPETWESLRRMHDAILRQAIESNNGFVFQIIGDAFCAAFHKAGDALKAALKAQQGLQRESWGEAVIHVRMGIHTGEAETDGEDYRGYLTLSLVQRVMSAGHGGQILLSNTTENLLRGQLPKDVTLRDLGEHKLKDVPLPVRISQVVAPNLPSNFPALRALDVFPNNLPAQLTSFIGREKEIAEIDKALTEQRLVTLTGWGGTGKTRLAIEVGAAQVEKARADGRFVNGVYFVALAPLETTEAIVPTIATALGFSFYEGGEPRQQLLDYLREKSMLLILDNFEHLLSGVSLVNEILNAAPRVKILATSRTRLNIQGEQIFHVSGMEFPDWETPQDVIEYSAVKLFMQSAQRICADFELTSDNLKYVTRICRLVDGMPLGILLAASWLEMLSSEEIANEIEKSLDFLETSQRDLPDRQHSMRAVFDYSWKLLTPGEQDVFKKASVFRGGFTREAAQQVTGASLRDLMGLVDKSLLQRIQTGRYEIHELLRQYGAEKLAKIPNELEAIRDQQSAYFAEYLHQREASLHGKDQRVVMAEIETEIDNIKIGWQWAVEHVQVERIADYLESVGELYDTRGWSQEGVKLFARTFQSLTTAGNDRAIQILRGQLLLWQGRLGADFDTNDNTNQILQASVAIFRELGAQRDMAYALSYYGNLSSYWESEDSFCQESLNIFKEVGDQRGIAMALRGLAWNALYGDDFPLAKQRFLNSLSLFRELGDQKAIARSLDGLGYTCWRLGEYKEAKQCHEESLALCKVTGDQYGIASSLADLGKDVYGAGDYQQTRELFVASLELYKEMGSIWGVAEQLADLGELMLAIREYAQASRFSQEALALYATVGLEPNSWELRIIGNAALGMEDLQTAQTYLRQSLQQALKIDRRGHALLALVGVAALFVKQGKEELALELLALVMNHHASWQMAKDQAAPLLAELEAKLPLDIVTQAKERGRARDLEATVAELLAELGELAGTEADFRST